VSREEELQIIDIELNQLEDFNTNSASEFFYSDHTLGSIAALSQLDTSELYLDQKPSVKVCWVLNLFWQVQGKTYDFEESWEKWKEFINYHKGNLEEIFFQLRTSLDFSMENLDKVENLLKRKKNLLNPSVFTYSIPASHLIAIIKNVIEYSGVVSAASSMRFKRLVYKKKQGIN
jgi:hypothetical protein